MSERNDRPSPGRRPDRSGRPGKDQPRDSRPGGRGRRRDGAEQARPQDSQRPRRQDEDGERPRRQDGQRSRREDGDDRSRRSDSGDRGHGRGDRRSPRGSDWKRAEQVERTEAQIRYDGPPIPDDITGAELHRGVQAQLRSLPDKLALRVARHLVAAARLLDSDAETAYRHTLAARGRAARIAMVREACGEAAYAAGHFKDALTEFKAARRMNGTAAYLPMMADCERALGRPERAVALAKEAAAESLDDAGRAEMTIVEASARRDLGDLAAALRTLESSPLRSRSRAAWSARLRYAYADTLLAAGRADDAREWFERAAGVDAEGATDATERLAELEGLVVVDLEASDED